MKRILISLLFCPLAMMAMNQEQQAQDAIPKKIYAGVIVTILNETKHKGTSHAFPVARQTFIYELPQNHTQHDTFEFVDTVEEWNEPHGQVKHIYSEKINYLNVNAVSFTEKNTTVSINSYYASTTHYPSSISPWTTLLKLGQVSLLSITTEKKAVAQYASAFFGKSTSSSQPVFLPYTSILDPRLHTQESTMRNECLAKKPGNSVATTIAFLRLEERRKGSTITYIPSPCTDLTTILEQDTHDD